MPRIEDRKLVHDVRNSMMVIRNLAQLLQEGKMPEKDKAQAFEMIIAESNKVIREFEEK
jgi:nitrogen-specific signal transduction histidine kinase